MHYFKPGLNNFTMNTNTCNISLKQHTLWGQQSLSGNVVAYIASNRGDFTPSMEQVPGG